MRHITGARVVLGRYSRAGAADARMNQAHYRPRPFDVHFQSDRNRVYTTPSGQMMPRTFTPQTLKPHQMPGAAPRTQGYGTGNVTFATGDLGQVGAAAGVSPEYTNVLNKYHVLGDGLGAEVVETASKALAIAEAAAAGAAIGAALGPIGAGAGAVIAGIYSTFDNFGDDIIAVFNPPDFKEDDYTRMKKNCMRSGGVPNYGHAPDNEDGCIYPDGTTSGGDYPRHPPPGVRAIRGDSFYDYDAVGNMCVDASGKYVPIPPGYRCLQGVGPVPPPPPPALLPGSPEAIKQAGFLRAKSNAALMRVKLIGQLKAGEKLPLGAERAYLSAADQAALSTKVPGGFRVTPPMKVANLSPSTAVALKTVAAAMTGDTKAAAQMAATVDAARMGDAMAINDARLMTHAQRLIMIQSFVSYYLPGTKTAGTAGGGCGCHGGCGGC